MSPDTHPLNSCYARHIAATCVMIMDLNRLIALPVTHPSTKIDYVTECSQPDVGLDQ
jgi:hypothetical protein